MAILQIPVNPSLPAHQFSIDLDNATYLLKFQYNARLDRWFLGVATTSGNDVVSGVPVQTGVNLFAQYIDPALPPGTFIAYDQRGQSFNAGRNDLGNDVLLLYQEAFAP